MYCDVLLRIIDYLRNHQIARRCCTGKQWESCETDWVYWFVDIRCLPLNPISNDPAKKYQWALHPLVYFNWFMRILLPRFTTYHSLDSSICFQTYNSHQQTCWSCGWLTALSPKQECLLTLRWSQSHFGENVHSASQHLILLVDTAPWKCNWLLLRSIHRQQCHSGRQNR